jgi:hypothetical protein
VSLSKLTSIAFRVLQCSESVGVEAIPPTGGKAKYRRGIFPGFSGRLTDDG